MIEPLYEENLNIVSHAINILQFVSNKTGEELRRLTHEMKIVINGEEKKIDDLPPYFKILPPMAKTNSMPTFQISDEWRETIEIWSTKHNRVELNKTFSSLSRLDFLSWKQVME